MKPKWDTKTMRGVLPAPFGIACYEIDIQDGEEIIGIVFARHKGVVGSVKSAKEWLDGKHPADLIIVYDETQGGTR